MKIPETLEECYKVLKNFIKNIIKWYKIIKKKTFRKKKGKNK